MHGPGRCVGSCADKQSSMQQPPMQTIKRPLLIMSIGMLPLLGQSKPLWPMSILGPCCVQLPRRGADVSDEHANSLTQASEHALISAGRARAGANSRGHAGH